MTSAAPATSRGPEHALVASILAAVTLAAIGLSLAPGAAVVAGACAALAYLVARPTRGLALFAWLLPIHSLVLAFLFGVLRLPENTVRLTAAWKEVLLGALVIAAAVRVLVPGRRGHRITQQLGGVTWTDLTVAGLIVLALCFLLADDAWLASDLTTTGRLYAFRDSAFFLFLYFVGRSSGHDVAEDGGIVRQLFAVGLILATVAVFEDLFVPPELLVAIGATRYFQEFLGLTAFTSANSYGLPDAYWTVVGGTLLRRAGATFLSSQGLAVAMLLFIPAASVAVFRRDRPARAWRWVAYGVVWIGLLLTFTRMSILAGLVEAATVALVFRRRWVVVGLIVGGIGVVIAGIALIPGLAKFLVETLTFQTSSSLTHTTEWTRGLQALADNPLGHGLGRADQIAARFGQGPALTGDNLYLKYGAELGVAGFLIHAAILVGIGATAWRLVRRASAPHITAIGALTLAATFGLAMNGMTAVVYNSNYLAYIYFWLGGSVVTLLRTLPKPGLASHPRT